MGIKLDNNNPLLDDEGPSALNKFVSWFKDQFRSTHIPAEQKQIPTIDGISAREASLKAAQKLFDEASESERAKALLTPKPTQTKSYRATGTAKNIIKELHVGGAYDIPSYSSEYGGASVSTNGMIGQDADKHGDNTGQSITMIGQDVDIYYRGNKIKIPGPTVSIDNFDAAKAAITIREEDEDGDFGQDTRRVSRTSATGPR